MLGVNVAIAHSQVVFVRGLGSLQLFRGGHLARWSRLDIMLGLPTLILDSTAGFVAYRFDKARRIG